MSDVDRRSMRILATSTKAAGPSNARIADRLERAAGTGDPDDYRKAEASFDALPVNERRRIGSHAEKQAETQRQLEEVRRRRAAEPASPPKRAPAVDDTLDWKPLMLSHSPATDPLDEPIPARRVERGAVPPPPVPQPAFPQPSVPRPAPPRPSAPRGAASPASNQGARPRATDNRGAAGPAAPGTTAADSGLPANAGRAASSAPPRPRQPAAALDPATKRSSDDTEKGWDWQRIPEDSVLKSTKKKQIALDPIAELRRQMLGDDDRRR